MKFDLPLPCERCGVRDPVTVPLMAAWWEWTCASCGHESAILSSEKWTIGWRIFEKAKSEYLVSSDYSTSIIFSAMAFEADLAYRFFKWRRIDTMQAGVPPPSEETLDMEYREIGRSIAEKIGKVSQLLDPRGIDEFAANSDLADRIENDYASLNVGSLARDIQQSVFWPRNRILHAGFLDSTQEDAKRVNNVASLGLDLLQRMDLARRRQAMAWDVKPLE